MDCKPWNEVLTADGANHSDNWGSLAVRVEIADPFDFAFFLKLSIEKHPLRMFLIKHIVGQDSIYIFQMLHLGLFTDGVVRTDALVPLHISAIKQKSILKERETKKVIVPLHSLSEST